MKHAKGCKMRKMIKVEIYKTVHYLLVCGALLIAVAMGFYVGFSPNYQAEVEWYMIHYPKIEYIVIIELCCAPLALFSMFATSYLGSVDFSAGTVRNALSVGVSRSRYFFARMAVYMLMILVMFGATMLSYGLSRFCRNLGEGQVNRALSMGEYTVIFLIMLLQLWALAAFSNMLCYFFRNQLIPMITVLGLFYVYVLVSELAKQYGLDRLYDLVGLFPARVLERCTYYTVSVGIFQFEFLRSGLSALAIIVVCSAIGYMRFRYSDQS